MVPRKVIEPLILETISRHLKSKKVSSSSQHGFTKWKSCLTDLITFHDELTGLVDKMRAVDVVCLNFSEVFNTISHNIQIDKLMKHGLDKQAGGLTTF